MTVPDAQRPSSTQHLTLLPTLNLSGVSRQRSTARASRSSSSIPTVVGCAPPSTRRAVLSISSSVVTASPRSSSVAPSSSVERLRVVPAHLERDLIIITENASRHGHVLRNSALASWQRFQTIKGIRVVVGRYEGVFSLPRSRASKFKYTSRSQRRASSNRPRA